MSPSRGRATEAGTSCSQCSFARLLPMFSIVITSSVVHLSSAQERTLEMCTPRPRWIPCDTTSRHRLAQPAGARPPTIWTHRTVGAYKHAQVCACPAGNCGGQQSGTAHAAEKRCSDARRLGQSAQVWLCGSLSCASSRFFSNACSFSAALLLMACSDTLTRACSCAPRAPDQSAAQAHDGRSAGARGKEGRTL